MQQLINTQTQLIAHAQSEYLNAINGKNTEFVDFWIGQLHCLCEQLKWMKEQTGVAVSQPAISNELSPFTMNQSEQVFDVTRHTSVEIITTPVEPTSYAWNDGFHGVTLGVPQEWED